jgi:GT2 family glycosyltransferase/2-polyprenyl-3-methyl-5-hydroxy-6-metoxy-1,4-benzoquinol methylase/tetratricopeptide (TPR) repeat protein
VNGKPGNYYTRVRNDLLALIPEDAKCVLDVGCGTGVLGKALKERQECAVFGIELVPEVAAEARKHLDLVMCDDIEAVGGPLVEFSGDPVDCLVFGDVLEHLRDPGAALSRCEAILRDGGSVVVSVPNVLSATVMCSLSDGRWAYQEAGILDKTHLRWFGLQDITELLESAGLKVQEVSAIRNTAWAEWDTAGRPKVVNVGERFAVNVSGENDPLFVEQWIVRAVKNPLPEAPIASIVIPCWNCLAETRNCVESLRAVPVTASWECVLVDNGSTDGTGEWMAELAASDQRFRVVSNEKNEGFARACNQGIAASLANECEFVVLLNNDTVVTPGWLDRLVWAAMFSPDVGLVGPVSNFVSGPQLVPASYEGASGLMAYAAERATAYAGKLSEVDRLVGFCLLIKREVIESIGALDERFGMGLWEDDDLCRRTREAGFRCMICPSCFVHHKGNATFKAHDVDQTELYAANEALYREKWGPEDTSRKGTVALTMIVKNEESNLPRLLASVEGLFDEIVVVDTGSTDRTVEIATAAGARVVEWAWRDDFAAARNVAIENATSDWCMWLDADDELLPDERTKLEQILRSLSPSYMGYGIRCRCHEVDARYYVDQVRIFVRDERIRFEGRCHEQNQPAILRAGGDVAWTDVIVDHHGYADPEALQAKLERNIHLLAEDLSAEPESPDLNFWAGRTFMGLHDTPNALACLHRCVRFSGGQCHAMAYAAIANLESQIGAHPSALRTCMQGLEVNPTNRNLLMLAGQFMLSTGEVTRGIEMAQKALAAPTASRLIGENIVSDSEIKLIIAGGYMLVRDVSNVYRWAGEALAAQPSMAPRVSALLERLGVTEDGDGLCSHDGDRGRGARGTNGRRFNPLRWFASRLAYSH